MSAAELPEGLGELTSWGHYDSGMEPELTIGDNQDACVHDFVRLDELLAWARPLQAKLDEKDREIQRLKFLDPRDLDGVRIAGLDIEQVLCLKMWRDEMDLEKRSLDHIKALHFSRDAKAKLEAAEALLAGVERIAKFWNPAQGDPCGAAETLYCAARAAGLGQGGSDGE